ncbi:maleylpyruvate isomerase N-terminal domain-containing protein [Streptomyces sp. NPDC058268]|uniref:maleylpyruvate isomerase N-terminal domain-containing protein n=1 Tax=Streptomyces sp. NPDC058268 TaxID=3346413 RepID=UPI0036F08344
MAEGDELDALVRAVDDLPVPTPTPASAPAPGWTIAHQIAHLAWADANALSALRTPDAFDAELSRAEAEGSRYADKAAADGAATPAAGTSGRVAGRSSGTGGSTAGHAIAPRIPLVHVEGDPGPDGTPSSDGNLGTRQDVFDAVGVAHRPPDRLQHVASLGVLGPLSSAAVGLPESADPLRVELTAPDGRTWV